MEKDYKALVKNTRLPILILDQKWHQLFLVNGKPEEVEEKEKELGELLKEEARLKKEVKECRKKKQDLMDEIVAGMDDRSEEHEAEVASKKEEIDSLNTRIEELEDGILDIPSRIKEVNDDLMVMTVDYCYQSFQTNSEKINEIADWIKQVRRDLKLNVVRKQNREINSRQIYSYMHDVFGPEITEMFDLENSDMDITFHEEA